MKHYINFVHNALIGTNQYGFFFLNERQILESAKLMHEKYPVEERQIFRGILLTPDDVKDGILKPLNHIKYLYFTNDKNIAQEFADVKSDLAIYMVSNRIDYKGYLIEHKAERDEILFHYSWIDVLGLDMYFEDDAIALLKSQEVIIIKQRMLKFKLSPVET